MKNRVYGYARISTKGQHIERQERNISALYPEAIIIKETYTGRKITGRKEFEALISRVKSGDKIVFDSVCRMSRNAVEGFEIYEKLFSMGVELEFIKQPAINTAVYRKALEEALPMTGRTDVDCIIKGVNEFFKTLRRNQIIAAFEYAQEEVDTKSVRQSEGIVSAQLRGVHFGLTKGAKLHSKKGDEVKDAIRKYSKDFNGTLSDVDVMKLCKCARNTYYKYKKEIAEE